MHAYLEYCCLITNDLLKASGLIGNEPENVVLMRNWPNVFRQKIVGYYFVKVFFFYERACDSQLIEPTIF